MAAPPHSDEDLLARVQSGDRAALILLYQRWGSFVHGLALAVTGSPDAATEITYHVFVLLWAEPAACGAGGSLRARLAALTHGPATRQVRQEHGGRATEDGDAWDQAQLAASLGQAAAVRGAASRALPEQRLALAMTYLAGLTIGDSARILGLSRSATVGEITAGLRHISAARRG